MAISTSPTTNQGEALANRALAKGAAAGPNQRTVWANPETGRKATIERHRDGAYTVKLGYITHETPSSSWTAEANGLVLRATGSKLQAGAQLHTDAAWARITNYLAD